MDGKVGMVLPTLFTARTRLDPLCAQDAAQIQAIFADWEVVKYLAADVPWPYPSDGAQAYLRDVALPAMARGVTWSWSIRLREDPARIIGVAELLEDDEHNRGFWLGASWHGQGLMTEASDAITAYWFDVLGKERLRVYKAVENVASRRLSEKSGMRVIATGERDFVCGRLPAEQWEITAEMWRRHRSTTR